MKSIDIRNSFLKFFKEKQHQIIPSASTVPKGDPSLLFINAGMNPFKDIFLGFEEVKYSRVANSQKCIRVSGKHNDLEEVGVDTYHHTFFEMLGSWSFNDYYKVLAIQWAWELLTKHWKLNKERLFVTYYHEDEEAREIWLRETTVLSDQVLPFGDKDNFWEMGAHGPCGPCTEIHYYRGDIEKMKSIYKDPFEGVNGENENFIEIWNLVFIQNNRTPEGNIEVLPKKYIDTGMGFERIVAILQNKSSNYETDLFMPIIKQLEILSGKSFNGDNKVPMQVIADHIRTLCVAISDGVTPSNEGRGYVIRRILRRAYRYGRNLDLRKPFLFHLVDVVSRELGSFFTEIALQRKHIETVIEKEEILFDQTLDRGIHLIEQILNRKDNSTIDGKLAFLLYDTYGFPFDLSRLIFKEAGHEIDDSSFLKEMEKQKERSKSSSQTFDFSTIQKKLQLYHNTDYQGETLSSTSSELLHIFDLDREKKILLFKESVFYGESGGQVGDTGFITDIKTKTSFFVEDTKKYQNYILHIGILEKGSLEKKKSYKLSIDHQRRQKIRQNHSSVHLIHYALRKHLGTHVQQAGSYVDDKKFRLDYSHPKALDLKEIETVEREVNRAVLDNSPIEIDIVPYSVAITQKKALAFFEEKYPEIVRVVNIGDYSIELCGGSHVSKTLDIGCIKILQEIPNSSGVRRIEGVSSFEVLHRYNHLIETQLLLTKKLKLSNLSDLLKKINQLMEENKILKSEKKEQLKSHLKSIISNLTPSLLGNNFYYSKAFENLPIEELKKEMDQLKNSDDSRIIFFINTSKDKHVLLLCLSKKALEKYDASNLIKEVLTTFGGKGGGKKEMAQGGVSKEEKIDHIFSSLEKLLFK